MGARLEGKVAVQGAMRTDSIIIGIFTVAITAAIIGGVYYMAAVRQAAQSPTGQSATWHTLEPQSAETTGNSGLSAETSTPRSPARTNTPIRCNDPELGEFWTNASTCDQADLHNRLSIAEPVLEQPQDPYDNKNYVDPAEQAARNRSQSGTSRQVVAKEPSLRGTAKSPPAGLSPECRFPVGKALEIERALSAADDPNESIWRKDYCKWLGEVWDGRCDVPADLFFYRNICDGL